uniref:Uncharacterized protein n=1 Tax=Romanomermis culicivorax TaxID=13658 RepID=A0A915KU87_ROMCU
MIGGTESISRRRNDEIFIKLPLRFYAVCHSISVSQLEIKFKNTEMIETHRNKTSTRQFTGKVANAIQYKLIFKFDNRRGAKDATKTWRAQKEDTKSEKLTKQALLRTS